MSFDTSPRCGVCDETGEWFRPIEPRDKPATEYREAVKGTPDFAFVCDEHRWTPDAAGHEWIEATPANVIGAVQGILGEVDSTD